MTANLNKADEVFVVATDDGDVRLDVFCASRIKSLSRNQIQKINKSGAIRVDGASRPDHYALSPGETVEIVLPAPTEPDRAPVPQDIGLRIAYEDDHLLIINKEAGMVVHPAHGNREGTVVNALLGRGTKLSSLGGPDRPGIVHRLDKDTSGLLVIAKSDEAYRGLTEQLKTRQVKKTYHAIVWGNLGTTQRTVDAPISRHPVQRQRMAVVRRRGREAITELFVVDSFEYFDYIRVVTRTGRTHQIRVHLAHISHPILGDSVYGGRRKKGPPKARVQALMMALLKAVPRQALNASRLSLEHPVTGERLNLKSALPQDIRLALELLHIDTRTQGGRR